MAPEQGQPLDNTRSDLRLRVPRVPFFFRESLAMTGTRIGRERGVLQKRHVVGSRFFLTNPLRSLRPAEATGSRPLFPLVGRSAARSF